jgi:redox-sensitive bicupin YhaK (pirin superfamily)
MTTGRTVRHKEANASRTEWVHFFRISLRPSRAGLDRAHEQKLFAAAQRHNELCAVASQDGRKGSLIILQNALVYSSVLDPGHHLIHELLPGRSAWLHVIHGEANLQDIILTQGDGVGVLNELSVSLTAQDNCEILLVDVGPLPESLASSIHPLKADTALQSRKGLPPAGRAARVVMARCSSAGIDSSSPCPARSPQLLARPGFLRPGPLMIRRRSITTATTTRTWMNPPKVTEETNPSTQSKRKMMAMVHNMATPLFG